MAYQKQFNLTTGEITGVEALLRLKDENGNILPNDKIIPQIEGESLFSLVVLESLAQLAKFLAVKDKIGFKDATLYLNVSAHTIMHPQFCSIFTDFVDQHNLKDNQFGLEVTETAELSDLAVACESLKLLKSKGIKIALDDFGAGYSSLSYLRDLPITLVKLDKNFSQTVSREDTQELVKFVVTICKNMDLGMLAEGIETKEEEETFIKLGCQKGQGYFHHRPQFLEQFKEEF